MYSVNMPRLRHPKKEVEAALWQAERAAWTVEATASGHRWGGARCPGDCPALSVWSTPRSPGDHAKRLRAAVQRCPHRARR